MKQSRNLAGNRVNAGQIWPLVAITVDASEGEILCVGWASVFSRNDVIDLKVQSTETLGEVAIFTSEKCSLSSKLNEIGRHAKSIRSAMRLEREQGFGLHELNEPADTKIVLQLAPFLLRDRTVASFGG